MTGSADQLVKVWLFKEGVPTHVGVGHAGEVTNAKVSPDCRMVVSTSADGGIFLWRFPHDIDILPPQDSDNANMTDTQSICSAREQQVERSRQLSQKKTIPARAENIKVISKKQKVKINIDAEAHGDGTKNIIGSGDKSQKSQKLKSTVRQKRI